MECVPSTKQHTRVYLTSSNGKTSRLENFSNSRVKGVVGRRLGLKALQWTFSCWPWSLLRCSCAAVNQMVIFDHFKNKNIWRKSHFWIGVIVFEDEEVPSARLKEIGDRAGTGAAIGFVDYENLEDFPTPPPGEGGNDNTRASGAVDYENLKSTKTSICDLPQNFEFSWLNRKDLVGLGIERKGGKYTPAATCQSTSSKI